jgi:hypothetical protein
MKKFLVLLTACALVAAFTVPAMAKMEWSFYGSSRLTTDVVDDDWEIQTGNAAQQFDDTDFDLWLQGNSRFGAWARSDTIVGRIEMGMSETNVSTRLIYGIWKLSWANFIIGQTYTPAAAQFLSNQVFGGDADLLNSGFLYAGRQAQLKFEIPFTNGVFEIAAIAPNSPAVTGWAAGTVVNGNALGSVETDTYMPKFEARLAYKFGPAQFRIGGGWNSYEVTGIDVINQEHERDIDTWFVVGDIMFSMGPFYANVGGHFGENPDEFGLIGQVNGAGQLSATYDATTGGIADVDEWGVVVVAGFKLNDMISFEAGWGHLDQDIDVAAVHTEDDVDTYYLQAVITPIKGVKIIPEIGVNDYGDLEVSNAADTSQGDETYYLIQWRIDF